MLTLLLISMLTLAFNIQPVKAEPRTWYVDDSGGADFTKIQDAIYAASPGDTIYVYNGTYYESLLVSKDDLTIVGESKGNTIIDGGGRVVVGIYSSRVVLSAFTVRNGGQLWYYVWGSAIILYVAQLCNISDNLVSDSRYGIVAYYGGKHIISSNTIRNTNQGIALYYSNNNTVFGNSVSEGVQVGSDPPYGIQIYGGGFFNLIMENIVTNIDYTGIRTTDAARNVIMGNMVSNTSVGISASYKSFLNTITGNAVSNNSVGVEIWDSNNNTVVDNSISTSTDRGISLEISYNNKIIGNTLSDNNYGINVGISHDNEVSNNTVANCTNEGIMMGESFSNTVTNNTITESNIAVYLGDSYSNNVSENMATSNVWGLWLVDSKDNEANHNKIINNSGGILVLGANSNGNIIRKNIIKNSTNVQSAIFLHTCNNNTICHNNFVENALPQIFNYASVNIWDDNYPSGGNYWSDYTGVDANGDGIGDTPYTIDADNQDRYPLMRPWSPLPVHNMNTGLGCVAIQEAINANETLNGHTIFVEEGIYYENVVVNKSLTLIGENREITIIDANGTGDVIDVKVDGVVIESFTIRNSGYDANGVDIDNCKGTTIRYNDIINNDCGIIIRGSENNTISGNNVTNNYWGIFLQYSCNNRLRNNHMSSNQRNFCVMGDVPFYFIHDIDSSNTVDGKPIYYWVNQQNRTVPVDAGYVALVYSTNITARNLDLKNNYQGLLLVETENSLIVGNNIINNARGIHLILSSNNTISENSIANNGFGIFLDDAINNTIFRNNIARNYYGISLSYHWWNSTGNIIYHNSFINNTQQASITSKPSFFNAWDNGYPSGGNYWSDYTGADLWGGPYQNETGSDGIGDAPYVIDAENVDNCPLMKPYARLLGDLNYDGKVDITDIAMASQAFGSYPGHPRWNPLADVNNDSRVDIYDIARVCADFGKT